MKHLQVTIRVSSDIPLEEAKAYIIKELASAGGSRPPDDPLFHGLEVLEIKTIKLVL